MYPLICVVVILLYARTWNWFILIDDPVSRAEMLWVITDKAPHPEVYEHRRPIMYVITNITVHLGVCLAIGMIWDFQVALLYSVCPLLVSAVTWRTGNYYQTTNLFILTAFYFYQQGAWGLPISLIFYYTALWSSVSAIPYAFLILTLAITMPQIAPEYALHSTIAHLLVLALFFSSTKFRTGLKLRKEKHERRGIDAGKLKLRNLFVVPKTIAYYIFLHFWPSRLGFFSDFGKREYAKGKLDWVSPFFWVAGVLILVFMWWGWQYSFIGMIWFLLFIGVFSQFIVFGQFVAERYVYIATVGFCLILTRFLEPTPIIYWILTSLWFYRSHLYVPAWKHNEQLFAYGVSSFPEAEENYNNLALVYIERGKHHRAITPLLCALKLCEGDKSAIHIDLYNCYIRSYEFERALLHLEEALKTCRKDQESNLKLLRIDLQDKVRKLRRNKKQLCQILK